MGKDSAIEWTQHTFNPWWGCSKISTGCQNCYAETMAKNNGDDVWGSEKSRKVFGPHHWDAPIKWNADAKAQGCRKRVFCASMADVFEARADLNVWRAKLWKLIGETQSLDWLLLTKRPKNIIAMVPWKNYWPENVWIGTTVENQQVANQRVPILLNIPAKIRFISAEPLLGSVDLSRWTTSPPPELHPINWVIVGGESGYGARPMLPSWAKKLRDQTLKSGIAFHFKQWGNWGPVEPSTLVDPTIRRIWDVSAGECVMMRPMGKIRAGRLLDGRVWDQFPEQFKPSHQNKLAGS